LAKQQKKICNYEILRSTFHITDRIIATATARVTAVHAGSSKALRFPLYQKQKYSNACIKVYISISGPDSVVGLATGYVLDGPGIESRWG
jgi:hypothetical protein